MNHEKESSAPTRAERKLAKYQEEQREKESNRMLKGFQPTPYIPGMHNQKRRALVMRWKNGTLRTEDAEAVKIMIEEIKAANNIIS